MADRKDLTDESVAGGPDNAGAGVEASDVEAAVQPAAADHTPDPESSGEDHTAMASAQTAGDEDVPAADKPPWRKPILVLVWVLLGLVIVAGGAGYWVWLQLDELRTGLARVDSYSSAQASALAEQHEQSNRAVREEMSAKLASANARISTLGATVSSLNLRLTEAEQSQPQALVIAEVGYLLELAANRLDLERDRPGALLALNRALARLSDVQSPAYAPLTEAIVAERARLEAFDAPDTANVVRRISALIDSVAAIDVAVEKLTPNPTAPAEGSQTSQRLKAVMSSVLHNLGQFVKVERAAGASPPTLIPDQQYYARENIRLSLKHARSAALRLDSAGLRLGLKEARRWLRQFPKRGTVAEMDAEVQALLALDFDVAYPKLTGSLAIARQLTAEPAAKARSSAVSSTASQAGEASNGSDND